MTKEIAHVDEKKIRLVFDLLNDPKVFALWDRFQKMEQPQQGSNSKLFTARNEAFEEYAAARDEFLGLSKKKKVVITEKVFQKKYSVEQN